MRTNEAGRRLIKRAEGLRLKPYKCPGGHFTIGYGSTRRVTGMTPPITIAQAEERFEQDLRDAEAIIDHHVTTPLNENQFSALASFCFNTGPGRAGYKDGFAWLRSGRQSTILTLLNAGNLAGASQQFRYWVNSGGKKLPGLVARRRAEQELFNTPVQGGTS